MSAIFCVVCCTLTVLHQHYKQKKAAIAAATATKSTTMGQAVNIIQQDGIPGTKAAEAAKPTEAALAKPKLAALLPTKFECEGGSSKLSSARESTRKMIKCSPRLVVLSPYEAGSLRAISANNSNMNVKPTKAHQELFQSTACTNSYLKPDLSIRTSSYMSPQGQSSKGSLVNKLSFHETPPIKPRPRVGSARSTNSVCVGGSARSVVTKTKLNSVSRTPVVVAGSPTKLGSPDARPPQRFLAPFVQLNRLR